MYLDLKSTAHLLWVFSLLSPFTMRITAKPSAIIALHPHRLPKTTQLPVQIQSITVTVIPLHGQSCPILQKQTPEASESRIRLQPIQRPQRDGCPDTR